MLTKSDFIKYFQCSKYLWLGKYKKELAAPITAAQQALFDEGYEVEAIAEQMFPNAKSAKADGEFNFKEDILNTTALLQEKYPVITQATISGHDLYSRCDLLVYNGRTDKYDIIEIKNSTKVKEQHLIDLAFQKICLEENGVGVNRTYLMHINNQYVRHGEIEPKKLLIAEEVTTKVNEMLIKNKKDIIEALNVLKLKQEPDVPIVRQCRNPYECPYIDYCWKDLPQNTIYDLWLSEDETKNFVDQGIVDVKDIPSGFVEGKKFEKYCLSVQKDEVIADKEKIKEELNKIQYPIYFLDYETYNSAVPLFDGYKPYEKLVFQYSLHILEEPGGELKHCEFLGQKNEDPTKELLENLKKDIGEKGSVIVWNQNFEKGCNNEMGMRHKEYAPFLRGVNDRVYDLMEIFKQGYYVDKGFCNSHSIKNVLPVIAPELSYKDLNIQEGNTASKTWRKVIDPVEKDRDKIIEDMLRYCELDTLAMVKIYEFLVNATKAD